MNSLEWEIFKRTGKIDHYLLLKEAEKLKINFADPTEFSEELVNADSMNLTRED